MNGVGGGDVGGCVGWGVVVRVEVVVVIVVWGDVWLVLGVGWQQKIFSVM